jgi:hypothetical protein
MIVSLLSEEQVDGLGERGMAIYEDRLMAATEPAHNRKFVAVHVDTGDYGVGRTSGDAMRAIRKKRSRDGQLFIRKIGDEPKYQLAARILGT